MGTHADFYVKTENNWEWIGGINWDGHPDQLDRSILEASNASQFKESVNKFMDGRTDACLSKDSWNRPWDDSSTTDYSYIFDTVDSVVYISNFGGCLHTLLEEEGYVDYCQQCDKNEEYPMDMEEYIEELGYSEKPKFPNMKK